MTETLVILALMTLLAVATVAMVRARNLFVVVILSGIYSFMMALVMVALDAVDVAMTEAAVGAGVAMTLALGALYLTSTTEKPRASGGVDWPPLLVCGAVGAVLVYGTYDLPPFGAANTPVNTGAGATYIDVVMPDTGIPNLVTAVLAAYRSFDTLGETAVVFCAGVGVLLLLMRSRDDETGA